MKKRTLIVESNLLYRNLARIVAAVLFCAPFIVFSATTNDKGASATIASEGKAKFKVVVSQSATEPVRKHAADLAAMLEKITGAKFAMDVGDGQEGIAVGTVKDFPQAPVNGRLDPQDVMRGDEYIIKTHAKGVWFVGATEVAVGHAVWNFLYRLGYRQYFPGQNWELVPSLPKLDATLDLFSTPDYLTRKIWFQYGTFKENGAQYEAWCVKNRIKSSFNLRNAHMYNDIVNQNKSAFESHPEYYALWKGSRSSPKLCISNPGLRQLAVDFVLRWFEKYPMEDSCSIEPTDGDGWCECEECAKLGIISNRTALLANEVAAAVQAKYGSSKYLGMLAYFKHSDPPTFPVNPQVIVTVCTRMAMTDLSVDELISGWARQGAKMGLYDYWSVNTWHRDLPGYPGGSRINDMAKALPDLHRQGVRFFSAESGDNWGPCGLGYYLASRFLWDVSEAGRTKELRSEFIRLCFKKASKPMDEFYDLIDGGNRSLQLDDIIGQMYRRLDEAHKLETDPGVLARIDELVQYTRYVELYRAYEALKAVKGPRQQVLDELLTYICRIRATGMVHATALLQDIPGYDKDVTITPKLDLFHACPRIDSALPLGSDEVAQILTNGVQSNPILQFKVIRYSKDLVPAAKALGLTTESPGSFKLHGRHSWFTWLEPGKQHLTVMVAGKVRLRLFAVGNQDRGESLVSDLTAGTPIEWSNPTEGIPAELGSTHVGLHRLEITSLSNSRVSAAPGSFCSVPANTGFHTAGGLYFYVPRGTTLVAGQTSDRGGVMKDDTGAVVFDFKQLKEEIAKNKKAYFMVPVPKGRDGTLWKMEGCSNRMLYTVPPYYARSAEELLLPKEVVDRDANSMK
jgi:hypothetical protein